MQSIGAMVLAALAAGFVVSCATYDDISNPPNKSTARDAHPLGAVGAGGAAGAATNVSIESGGGSGSGMSGSASGSAAGGSAAAPVGAAGSAAGGGSAVIAVTPPSMCGAARAGSAVDKLIDDMEDGDGKVSPAGGRAGDWFTYHDTSAGTQSPLQGAAVIPEASDRPESAKAMHTMGSGFS